VITLTVTAVILTGLGGCGKSPAAARWVASTAASSAPSDPASGSPSAGASASASASASESPTASASCAPGTAWECDQQRRFAAATTFIAHRSGKLAVILHDRTTGAVWRAGTTDNSTWTASTIKLAIATSVLESNRAGTITLDSTDRSNLHQALVNSSNDAATALWTRYGGQPMFDRFRTTYGMTSLAVVSGYELFWRNLRCSAEDLHHLMMYVLDTLNPDDRAYLLGELRGVASNQQWGVWAAGTALRPGNKDGWVQKPDTGGGAAHWVTHTVGFAGPGERYAVVVTYSLTPSGTLSDGVHTVSDLVATIFGKAVPAKVSSP
jgi:hypothetical protein